VIAGGLADFVIPAKAGIHFAFVLDSHLFSATPSPLGFTKKEATTKSKWIPAFAGMTSKDGEQEPIR
jgi:hypothetical protein